MTYFYMKTSTSTVGNQKPNQQTINQWIYLANKQNWRIVQLPNGFYQTECLNPNVEDDWQDVTRRETIEGAEAAIDASIDHFNKRVEAANGPKIVKTFK